jgi:hypothetical protein
MTAVLHTVTDPLLAGYLDANGVVLDHCQRLGPKKVAYRFITGERLHGLLRLYWSGQPVPMVPGKFAESLRKLKRMSIFRNR